ncbi:MAG: hypothetical protein AAF206_23625 [Bacteroidota bacterium]
MIPGTILPYNEMLPACDLARATTNEDIRPLISLHTWATQKNLPKRRISGKDWSKGKWTIAPMPKMTHDRFGKTEIQGKPEGTPTGSVQHDNAMSPVVPVATSFRHLHLYEEVANSVELSFVGLGLLPHDPND